MLYSQVSFELFGGILLRIVWTALKVKRHVDVRTHLRVGDVAAVKFTLREVSLASTVLCQDCGPTSN